MPHADLHLGTSSWSSADWDGVFYPKGMAARDYLAHYATKFRSVEVDATFYRVPALSTTRKWRSDLPEGFKLAAKVPQAITHEKGMVDCAGDLAAFLAAMEPLGDRLGPLLLQFPYYKKDAEMTEKVFLERLDAFLPLLSADYRFALEIRNKGWLKPALFDRLSKHRVAFALIDHPWMPNPAQYSAMEPFTADFAYVRWLGDRYAIEKITKSWDRVIVDRSREMESWVPLIKAILEGKRAIYAYFNNHYSGHAPGSIELFEKIWREKITPA